MVHTKVVSVNGSFNDWAGQNLTWTESGYTATIKLNAGTYTFKIVKDSAWLGNNGTIADTTTTTSDVGWAFADAGDCTLVATGGTYTFTFNFDTNFLVITCDHIHSHVAGQVIAPTCTDKGYTVYTCACGDSYNGDEVAALGHNYVGKVTTEATCTTDGVKTFTCSKCSDSYTEKVTATGHSYAGGKCGSCGDTKVVSVNGSFNDWAGQNMTWTENGYTVTIKLDAGEYKFKIIKDGTWLGNNGTIVDTTTATSDIGWEFMDANDCTLITTGGTYTFTFNFDTNFLVLTYTHSHAFAAGQVVEPTCTEKGYTVYSCPCGDTENRDEIPAKGHSYDNGEITTAPGCTSEGIKTFTCGSCGDTYTENVAAMGHSYVDVVTDPTCSAQGFTTHTCSRCSDSYVDSYVNANGHSYQSVVTPPECTKDGYTTHTCSVCGNSYKDSYVSPSGHTWNDATCTEAMTCSVCGTSVGSPLGHSYKAVVTAPDCVNQGYTTHTCAICSDTFTDGYVPANGHSWTDATCTDPMTCSVCKATSGEALGHRYSSVVTAPECLKDGYTTHTCSVCGDSYRNNFVTATGHSWSVATCTAPMTCSKCQATLGSAMGHSYVDVVTDPTCTTQGYTTHTCSVCSDSYVDSYTDPTGHIWVDGKCECGKYALQHTGATLTLESEVKYNLYFYLNDPTINLENAGLLTFLSEPTDATVENASYVLDTMFYDSNQNSNAMRTQGIPAKEMGDTLYLRLYATMEDGTIVYGKLISYSAKTYATNILKKASSSETLKNTVVALMNYGAEAQKRLGYKTDTLMNAEISADYQAMQVPYSADLLDGRVKADAAKIAGLAATEGAFTSKYAQLTLEGALAINYLFQANKTVDNDQMTLYYWTSTTYANEAELTLENADGTLDSTINGSFYQFVYDGIAAKEMDDTIYVLAVYESEGEACMSGVVSYSVEHFCRSQINSATQNAALCEALTIYGYYAKLIFNVD